MVNSYGDGCSSLKDRADVPSSKWPFLMVCKGGVALLTSPGMIISKLVSNRARW